MYFLQNPFMLKKTVQKLIMNRVPESAWGVF